MQLGTHLDALSHLQIGDRGYNGWSVAELAGTAGVTRLGVETVPQIVTRGWLVDVAAARLGSGDVIGVEDIAIEPGARRRRAVPHRLGRALGRRRRLPLRRARPGPELAEWLVERGVALTGCDTWSYGPVPPRTPPAVRGPTAPQRPPRRVHRREPRHVRARARRRARVRADPHPPQAARRHRRVDLADRPRLKEDAMNEHYDVIIIGTGAGGGTLAHRLAPSGKRILLLERGGYLPARARELGLRARSSATSATSPPSAGTTSTATRSARTPQYFVGGNTKVYGAILFRLRERDFDEVRHYGGVSPAWPISYADLEPYYAEAERLYLVHGQAGEDPTEPPRSRPVPLPRRLPRAAHPAAARRSRAHGPPAVPPARRRRPRRVRPRSRPLRALRPLRRLPLPGRRQGRRARPLRAPRAQAPQRHAAHARAGRAARDRRRPDARVERVVVDREGERGDLQRRHRRRLLRRRQLGRAAAALGERQAPRTAWRTPPTSSAATTWPT